MEERIVEIGGRQVRIVRRARMRSIRLRLSDDGTLRVSAAKGVPVEDIRAFVERSEAWIVRQERRLADSPQAQAAFASEAEKREWRASVEAAVPALLAKWEPVIGAHASKLAYRDMKSRWGSCQPETGRVCINTRLALYPPGCLEYVVVHELVHLLEPGHGPRFRSLMDRFLPDWRERRELLR